MTLNKLKKLLAAYVLLLILVVCGYYSSLWLTGVTHPHSIVIHSEEIMVEYGHTYRSLYTGELIFYALMFFFMISIWILHSDKYSDFDGPIDYFLASKKMNIISGVLFSFAGIGIVLTGKTVPDPVLDFLTIFNLSLVFLVVLRFFIKEVYLRRRSKT